MTYFKDYARCPQCNGVLFVTVDDCQETSDERCRTCGRKHITKKDVIDDSANYSFKIEEGLGILFRDIIGGLAVEERIGYEVNEDPEIIKITLSNDPRVNKEKSYLTVWDKKNGKLKLLFGKLPGQYEDFMENEYEKLTNKDVPKTNGEYDEDCPF